MIKIKIQTDHKLRFTVPIPYIFLRIFGSLLSSRILWRQAIKWMNHPSEFAKSTMVSLDPKVIKLFLNPIIDELQQQKGLIVVDVKSHDGTQVMIKL